MSTIGGPKSPQGGPQRSAALQRFLEAERSKRGQQPAPADEAKALAQGAFEPKVTDRFANMPALSGANRAVPGGLIAQGGPGQGALSLRLGAMTGGDVTAGVERAGLRVVHGPGGKVAEGDLSVQKASDLEVMRGVVLLRGSLDLSETLLTPADLAALSTLTRIDGGLALEGNAALTSLDALAALAHLGGNLYLGFNDGLEVASLPALARVGGAVIVEGNASLQELSLPALTQLGSYLHLHENDALAAVALDQLEDVGGEVSLLDNPLISSLALPALRVAPDSIS